ncbi:MAG: ester cyclase [Nitrososphaerota archaeon]|nr:ester cyclase [Nitrososphaerota archaeon]
MIKESGPEGSSKIEVKNVRSVIRYDKAWTSGNAAQLSECVSSQFLAHGHKGTQLIQRDKYLESVSQFSQEYKVIRFHRDMIFAKKDMVASAYTGELVHKKRDVHIKNFRSINIYRLRRQKIVELWFGRDELALYQGLGILPSDQEIMFAVLNLD